MADDTLADRSAAGHALGRVPSGLYVLTARDGDLASGMLASWVQQAGFDPPMLSVALHRDRFLLDWVQASGRFALSQLRSGEKALLKRFGKPPAPDQGPFDGLRLLEIDAGGPGLADAMAYLNCLVDAAIDSGDHRIVLARVVGGGLLAPEDTPYVHVRQNGFHY